MKAGELKNAFAKFIANYNYEQKDEVWASQSNHFRNFWNDKVMAKDKKEISESDIDEAVLILDKSAKGSTKITDAIARAMIPQGAWRRMFNEIKRDRSLSVTLDKVFKEKGLSKKASLINKVYKVNEGNKNNLTGKSGNAIGAMLAAWDPFNNISVISLNDRQKIYNGFKIRGKPDFIKDSIGDKIALSNEGIKNYFSANGINFSARTLSKFVYNPIVKEKWRGDGSKTNNHGNGDGENLFEKGEGDPALFYLESHLEDFLIQNWDKTELGKKYDLISEEGELVSQQYKTDSRYPRASPWHLKLKQFKLRLPPYGRFTIHPRLKAWNSALRVIGRIDILAREKKTGKYVVIELKKNQTSDDTVGQLARYMGWLEEHKTKGKPTKGIIIAGNFDKRLHYAMKKMADTEAYIYRVNFKVDTHGQARGT